MFINHYVLKLFVKINIRDVVDIVTEISLRALVWIVQYHSIMSVNTHEFLLLPLLLV